MRMSGKTSLWIAGGLSFLLVVSIAVALLLPRLLDLTPVKAKIIDGIYQKTGMTVDFNSFRVMVLPKPCAVIQEASFTLPGKLNGTVNALKVFPHVLPLLVGDIAIADLSLEGPQLSITLPESDPDENVPAEPFSLSDIKGRLTPLLAFTYSPIKDVSVLINRGEVTVHKGQKGPLRFTDIKTNVRRSSQRLALELSCKSNLWENASLQGYLNPDGFISKGKINLKRFNPQNLADYGTHPLLQQVGASEINLDLSFQAKGFDDLEAEFSGSAPRLTLTREQQSLELQADTLRGAIQKKADITTLSLNKGIFAHPQLEATGTLMVDSAAPQARLHVQGKNVDATETREAALFLWGKNRTTRKIFNVVRGGHVPEITYDARGSFLTDFKKSENYVIVGSMTEGVIYIPKVRLEVRHAQGSVVIAHGILDGKDLKGSTSGSHGRDGILNLALKKDEDQDGPFHLDIKIDADLTELPGVLKRVVKSKPFVRELDLMKVQSGRAIGRLILGERLKSVDTIVDATQFNIAGHYQRVPYPIEVIGSTFHFTGTRIAAEVVNGRLGQSSVSNLSFAIDWGEKSSLLVASPSTSRISADEMFPWLTTYETIKKGLNDFVDVKGTLLLDSVDLQGPFRNPREWKFLTRGSTESFVMQTSFFPAPATIAKGEFEATHETLSLRNCRTNLLDGDMVVGGNLQGYLGGKHVRDLNFQGTIGEQTNQWISNLISLPYSLWARSPVKVQQAHLVWEKEGPIAFSGAMGVKNGPSLSIEVKKTPEALTIDRLDITDETSKAAFVIRLKPNQFDLDFHGNLNHTSLDKLLLHNDVLTGSVEGSFQSHTLTTQTGKSTANGEVRISGLVYEYGLSDPVTIENASLTAQNNRMEVKSAVLDRGSDRLTLDGTVDFLEDTVRLNLDVSTPQYHWGGSSPPKGAQTKPPPLRTRTTYLGKPLDGIVRFRADSFNYGKLVWKPFLANILFHDGMSIDVLEANLCGIPTMGKIEASPQEIRMDVKFAPQEHDLDSALTCLWNKSEFMTGTFQLSGQLSAKGPEEELIRNLHGNPLEFSAKDGRIYRLGVLSKIFAILNFTELYRGKVPDLVDEGFAYETVKVEGKLREGKLVVEKALLSAPSMRMAWEGEVDLTSKTMDINVIVAPLRTMDKIVNQLPILNRIVGDALIAIPVKVTGNLDDPDVSPLSPASVGSELLGFMKRTVQLPIRVIEPMWK